MASTKDKFQKPFITLLVGMVVLITIITISTFFYGKKLQNDYENSRNGKYYAVFLSNGQIYFGHLMYEDTAKAQLTDIFYLQAQEVDTDSDTSTPQYSLIKLGEELHGPKDKMYINREHMLFWEELEDDSQIVTAIESYKENGSQSDNVQQPTPTQQTEPTTQESDVNLGNSELQ